MHLDCQVRTTADGDAEARLATDLLALFPHPAAAPPLKPVGGPPLAGGDVGGGGDGFNNCHAIDGAGMTEVLRHLAAQVRVDGLGLESVSRHLRVLGKLQVRLIAWGAGIWLRRCATPL